MSLKKKVIAMICAVFTLSGALHLLVQQLVVMPSFYELEREGATNAMRMILESLHREFRSLSIVTADWAYWDDLHSFAAGTNPDFLETNLNRSSLETARLNLINIYGPQGNRIWGGVLDLRADELDDRNLSLPRLPLEHPLLKLPGITSEVSGFCRNGKGALMVVARNILTNERKGPVRGILVMGRNLDIPAAARMAEQFRLELSISTLPAGEEVPDWTPLATHSISHSRILLRETPEKIYARTIISDIHDRPLLRVEVAAPREISERGRLVVLVANKAVGFAGILILGLLMFMLHRTILTPLGQLTRHSVMLGETDDLRSRLALDRRDEIGALAGAFDQMIARLAEARRKLVDQSFQAGIAEMARGVLHNIGNALTPLQVQIATLRDELRTAPAREMEMALKELEDPATPADRLEERFFFVEVAGRELAEAVGRAATHVEEMTRQLRYVQQILADQNHYARAARIMEPLDMADMIVEAGQALSAPMRKAMSIHVDPGVRGVGRVLASRTVLQQVVANLLVNAAESILECGAPNGRLQVFAACEVVDGLPMAHFFFEDNGGGIPAGDLEKIFQPTFSTKKRNSGLGLHWCANTVCSMQGLLFAGNNSGGGACLHLLLPLAAVQEETASV